MSKAIILSSATAKVLLEKARGNSKLVRWTRIGAIVLLAVLVLTVWTLAAFRYAQKKALETYRGWYEEYKVERLAIDTVNADPAERKLDAEAEMLARVLYGVKDNSTDDLKTMCWCVFNRVDNPAFPDTLDAVIAQPQQWMRYDVGNPVLESLFQIAREQLVIWREGGHRPVSADYVYMSWTAQDIVLRDAWMEGRNTRYWRYAQ